MTVSVVALWGCATEVWGRCALDEMVDVYPRCCRVARPFGLPSAGFVAALQSPRAVLAKSGR